MQLAVFVVCQFWVQKCENVMSLLCKYGSGARVQPGARSWMQVHGTGPGPIFARQKHDIRRTNMSATRKVPTPGDAPNIRIDAPNRFRIDAPNIRIDAPNIRIDAPNIFVWQRHDIFRNERFSPALENHI